MLISLSGLLTSPLGLDLLAQYALVLIGKAGLLDGREATAHWRTLDFLLQAAPAAYIRKDL
jgi:transcriptional regulator GlxA family with amidase domain